MDELAATRKVFWILAASLFKLCNSKGGRCLESRIFWNLFQSAFDVLYLTVLLRYEVFGIDREIVHMMGK